MNSDKYWEPWIFSLIVLTVAFVLSFVVRFLIGRFIRGAARKLKVDPTRYNFFKNAVDFIIFLIAVIIIFRSIPSLRTYGTTLLTGAGVLAAIVGFASQSAFSNIISGFFLVIFKPFSVGDRVKIGQLYSGDIEDITLRHTIIKDFENKRVIIPNSVISNETIINSTMTEEKLCVFIEIAISLSADLNKAMEIMQTTCESHPYCFDNRSDEDRDAGHPKVDVKVITFLDSGLQLRAYAWSRNSAEAFDMKCDLNKSIKEKFDQQGVIMSNLHRYVVLKNL